MQDHRFQRSCAAVLLFLGLAFFSRSAGLADTGSDNQYATALALFLSNQRQEAIAILDGSTLLQEGRGALLRGVAYWYDSPDYGGYQASKSLHRAAGDSLDAAYIVIGTIGLELTRPECVKCLAHIAAWFRAALPHGDPMARLGLAAALAKAGQMEPEYLEQLTIVSEGNAVGFEKAIATTALGRMYEHGTLVEANATKAAQLYSFAANLGYAEAQFRLGMLQVNTNGPNAERWVAMAALQGNREAKQSLEVFEESELKVWHQAGLMELQKIAQDRSTALGAAAEWCKHSGRQDLDCWLTSLEHHIDCMIPISLRMTLGIVDWERTAVYGTCRSRRLKPNSPNNG